MTPDAYANLRILNCTNLTLGCSNVGSYQMSSWFPVPPSQPAPLVQPQSSSQQYLLQFLRGAGDNDDAGNLNINLGAGSPPNTIVFLYGGSASNSAHYLQVTMASEIIPPSSASPGGPAPGPFVIGLIPNGDWDTTSSSGWSTVNWYPVSGQTIGLGDLGVAGSGQIVPKVIAIVDLGQLYLPSNATTIAKAISANALESSQAQDLWVQVSAYCGLSNDINLKYNIPDLTWTNTPPAQTSQDIVQKFTYTFDSGTVTHTFGFTSSYENSISFTADQTWSLGAEIGFETSIPFLPNASLNGSFQAGSSETSTTMEKQDYTFQQEITFEEPGSYLIEAYLNVDNNYQTNFTGTLTVTGTFGGAPLTGSVLSSILKDPGRNQGWQISSQNMTVNPTSVTAAVSGTVQATVAFSGGLTETKISTASSGAAT